MKAWRSLAIFVFVLEVCGQGTITFYNNGIARPYTTDAAGNRTYTYDPNVDGAQPTENEVGMGPAHPLISADGSTYRAGVFLILSTGAGSAGNAFTAGLFLTSDLSLPLATTTFRTNNTFEVFANNQTVIVPNTPTGSTPNFTIRVWETGKTYNASTYRGQVTFTSQPLGGPVPGNPDAAPASLLGFNGFTFGLTPEPSTMALSAFGLAALALVRRRK